MGGIHSTAEGASAPAAVSKQHLENNPIATPAKPWGRYCTMYIGGSTNSPKLLKPWLLSPWQPSMRSRICNFKISANFENLSRNSFAQKFRWN